MRKSIAGLASLAAILIGGTAAQAQTATQAITLNATVPHLCTVGNAAAGTTYVQTVPINASGSVNTSAIVLNGATFATVACNSAAKLQLTSTNNGITTGATAVSGFAGVINYSASATWDSTTASITTNGGAAPLTGTISSATAGANSGTLSVTITPTANASPLLTGSYTDTLTLSLIPQ